MLSTKKKLSTILTDMWKYEYKLLILIIITLWTIFHNLYLKVTF